MKKIVLLSMALCCCLLSCDKEKKKILDPRPVTPNVPTWKILWLVYPHANYPSDHAEAGKAMPSLTDADIEVVKEASVHFKKFIEDAAKGKVIMKITIDVSPNKITQWGGSASGGYTFYQEQMPEADRGRLKFNKVVARNGLNNLPQDYDCVVTTTPGNIRSTYAGVTNGHHRWCHIWFSSVNKADFGRSLYVHEWIHQLERVFEGCKEMPCLHCNPDHAYTNANTGLTCNECTNEKWYHDILGGCIETYEGATQHHKGIASKWWEYPPLLQDKIAESEGLTSTSNGQQKIVKRFCE